MMVTEALDFIRVVRPMLVQPTRLQDYILNMDQTPVFFTMVPRTTLNCVGEQSLHVRSLTNSTMQVTVAVTVTASGKMLPSKLVFKGKPGGRIQREFNSFPNGGTYACQERAWMDEEVMKAWVNDMPIPYCATAPDGIHPFQFLIPIGAPHGKCRPVN